MLTYLLPTRDRPERLARTLHALSHLDADAHAPLGGAEVMVVDDASKTPAAAPKLLDNDMPVRLIRTSRPQGAAARNIGAEEAAGDWLVMLDDDSAPIDEGLVDVLATQPDAVAAVGGQILLDDGQHEAGGLPEVVVGCGAAVRRSVFLDVGGYDPSFHYYAEEYDLCARIIRGGGRIVHDWRFQVRHHKTPQGRDMNLIMRRLVRNNAWVIQRYAPDAARERSLRRVIDRYAGIAAIEHASFGYERGMDDLMPTIDEQPRAPLADHEWDRFTGRAAATTGLASVSWEGPVALVDDGKHAAIVRDVLADAGAEIIDDEGEATVQVIGTLSPGPMMDAWSARRAAAPPGLTVRRAWTPDGAAEATPMAEPPANEPMVRS